MKTLLNLNYIIPLTYLDLAHKLLSPSDFQKSSFSALFYL